MPVNAEQREPAVPATRPAAQARAGSSDGPAPFSGGQLDVPKKALSAESRLIGESASCARAA